MPALGSGPPLGVTHQKDSGTHPIFDARGQPASVTRNATRPARASRAIALSRQGSIVWVTSEKQTGPMAATGAYRATRRPGALNMGALQFTRPRARARKRKTRARETRRGVAAVTGSVTFPARVLSIAASSRQGLTTWESATETSHPAASGACESAR